ncbi:hypothetical protein WJX72_002017 [[Myrmecia] bisecta]|uniref:50S ribosomal protein L35 n=1 Tax=[Myrmecia] bisecta TaxID=41462 RepID=A0AAW1R5G5_9CHLO
MACLTAAFSGLSLASSRQACKPSTTGSVLCARRSSFMTSQRLSVSRSTQGVQQCQGMSTVVAGYKLKTRKAAAKRYKVTGSGKVMTRKPGKQHINEKKSPKRLNRLGKMKQAAHSDLNNIIGCLPHHGVKK